MYGFFQRGCLASAIHFFASAWNVSTDMPVEVAARSLKRSASVSFSMAARSPFKSSSTVEYGATLASSGFAFTSAGTLSRTYITCV